MIKGIPVFIMAYSSSKRGESTKQRQNQQHVGQEVQNSLLPLGMHANLAAEVEMGQ